MSIIIISINIIIPKIITKIINAENTEQNPTLKKFLSLILPIRYVTEYKQFHEQQHSP